MFILWALGWLSSIANVLTGGKWPEPLCVRVARKHGSWCWFCRLVGKVLGDPLHCLKQLLDAKSRP